MFARRARSGDWISWLRHPAFAGAIGLTRLPGILLSSLANDLAVIRASGATCLVTLTEARELRWAGRGDFAAEVERAALVWHHLPIRDFGVPDARFEAEWQAVGPELRDRLEQGERLVIHCYAGLGRTGLITARLLIEFGEDPDRAIALVRSARRGSIQTAEQETYLRAVAGAALLRAAAG
jgi:ADP-ribosyl-[dinitrogen reductase] hydrolase